VAILLGLMLLASLFVNILPAKRSHGIIRSASYSSSAYGPKLEEITLRENLLTTDKIAVIPVTGIISGEASQRGEYSMVTLIREELNRASHDSNVKAVIIKVNSPGGEVLASDEIANYIREFQTNSSKPVVVSMGSLAASGGYYISAPCDWIVANDLTITGSIGVIMHGFNYRGLLDKIGVKPQVFKSGKFKDMLSGTKSEDEILPEEKQMVQHMIDETFGKFKEVVASGRKAAYKSNHQTGKPLATDWESYADGRILTGKEALKLGFVDETGDFETALKSARNLAGINKAEVVEYQQLFDFSNLFKMFGESKTQPLKVDIGLETPNIKAGYMYFISPTYLQ
jgi:protease-4